MGFLRSSGFVLASIVLFCLLVIIGTLLTISYSLEYKTLEPKLGETIQEFFESEINITGIIEGKGNSLEDYCSNHNLFYYDSLGISMQIPCSAVEAGLEETVSFITSDEKISKDFQLITKVQKDLTKNYNIMLEYCLAHDSYFFSDPISSYESNLDCNKFLSEGTPIFELAVGNFIKETYYKEYNCAFFDCFSKTGSIFFLTSEHSMNYFKAKASLLVLIALFFVGIMFVLAEKRSMVLVVSGALLIVSSFFIKITVNTLLSLGIPEFLNIEEMNFNLNTFLSLFFTKISFVIMLFLILGIFLFILGFLFRFLIFRMIKKKIFENKVNKAVKQEIENVKSSEANSKAKKNALK